MVQDQAHLRATCKTPGLLAIEHPAVINFIIGERETPCPRNQKWSHDTTPAQKLPWKATYGGIPYLVLVEHAPPRKLLVAANHSILHPSLPPLGRRAPDRSPQRGSSCTAEARREIEGAQCLPHDPMAFTFSSKPHSPLVLSPPPKEGSLWVANLTAPALRENVR